MEDKKKKIKTVSKKGKSKVKTKEPVVKKGVVDSEGPEEAPKQRKLSTHPDLKWYVVHTYSGYENKAKKALEDRAKSKKLDNFLGEILIPSENVLEMVKGKKRAVTKKFFPGYVLVQIVLTPETWHLVRGTPRVTGFVGNSENPTPIPEEDVLRLTKQITEGTLKSKPRITFDEGDQIRVIEGPFANFSGVVEDVKPDKGKVRVLVSIFGRSTPVELDFSQVEKVA